MSNDFFCSREMNHLFREMIYNEVTLDRKEPFQADMRNIRIDKKLLKEMEKYNIVEADGKGMFRVKEPVRDIDDLDKYNEEDSPFYFLDILSSTAEKS